MTPPAYPVQKSGPSATKVLLIVLGVIALLCLVLGASCMFMGSQLMKQVSPMMNCMMTAEMAHTSLKAYATEHDGKLPNGATWEDDIAPYYKRLYESKEKEMKQASEVPVFGGMFKLQPPGETFKCNDNPPTGFAFNSDLSGADLAAVANPTSTPIFFEVNGVSRNNHMPAASKPSGKGPEIMGERREWVIYYADGNKEAFSSSSSSSESFDFNVEDALEKKK